MQAGERPTVVCLTPVRDEAWIIDRFVRCAALWADRIIVADQGSTDGTREILARHAKVTVVDNHADHFDEAGQRRLLLDELRRVPEPRVVFALDADEVLAGDFSGPQWDALLRLPPGTGIRIEWVNLMPGMETAWCPRHENVFGFVDDGRRHPYGPMHVQRLPAGDPSAQRFATGLRVLHFQYLDWERMEAKQRWYQCVERLTRPERGPVRVFRDYHRMTCAKTQRFDRAWLDGPRRAGIDLSEPLRDPHRGRFDRAMRAELAAHGPSAFRRLDLWGADLAVPDPRRLRDRVLLRWLRATQRWSGSVALRVADRLMSEVVGW